MADYIAQTDSQLDPDAPLTSELAYGWRDNLIAVTEGAVGAPRIEDGALSTTITPTGVDWVLRRVAAGPAVYPGQRCFMSHQGPTAATYAPGDITDGSNLKFTSGGVFSATASNGSWMCCGYCITDNTGTIPLQSPDRKTTWMRIS